jgi:hypothetical protein
MIVRAAPGVHARIDPLLKALREGRSMMVLARCRLVRPTGDVPIDWTRAVGDPVSPVLVATIDRETLRRQVDGAGLAVERNAELTMYNGQRAHIAWLQQRAFIDRYEPDDVPVIEVVSAGDLVEVKPTVSQDRRYVTLELDARRSDLLAMRRYEIELGNGTRAPYEKPAMAIRRLQSTVTIPDGGAVVLRGFTLEGERGDVVPDAGDPDLYLVVEPRVIRFEEVETGL